MSDRKRVVAVIISSSLLLTSCGAVGELTARFTGGEAAMGTQAAQTKTVEQLVAEGTLSDMGVIASSEAEYETVPVQISTITRNAPYPVRVITPIMRDLRFERDNGRLKTIYVNIGDRVKKGDVLAEITFDTERLQAERDQAVLQHALFEQTVVAEDARFVENLEKARASAESAGENDFELLTLQLMRLELEYEQFKYNTENTRKQQAESLRDIDEQLNGEQLIAPYDGIIMFGYYNFDSTWYYEVGDLIRNWQNMFTIIVDNKIQFEMDGLKDVVRYGDKFMVTNNDETISFMAKVVSDPLAEYRPESNLTYTLEPEDPDYITGIIESGVNLLALGSRLALTAQPLAMNVQDVMVVPQKAVNPENQSSFVNIYEDDIIKKRYVSVGLSYGENVQILDGLAVGQSVVIMP